MALFNAACWGSSYVSSQVPMPKVLNRLIVVAVEKPSCCGHGHNDLNVFF